MKKQSEQPEWNLFSQSAPEPNENKVPSGSESAAVHPQNPFSLDDYLSVKGRDALTVSELNQYVSELLGADPILRQLRVEGEISGFKRHTSGHLYFSLKDGDALVRCVMFRTNAVRLTFQPKDGMRVVLRGHASLYLKDGSYQLYAQSLEHQGEGALYQKFLQLKVQLEQEGYFDAAHKKPIPFLPGRVGVVTSDSGAAVHDIMEIIARRFPPMPIVIAPVRVQGQGAAQEIAGAIEEMNRMNAADVLIVGRGGGSMEDLWAFNERTVAEAIYASRIPVISAVGHETDFSIADFVADLRAPTPSAAAELAVPEWDGCIETIQGYSGRLKRALIGGLTHARSRVKLAMASRGFLLLSNRVASCRQSVDDQSESMIRLMKERLSSQRNLLQGLTQRIEALSPLEVLGRGYALARNQAGETVTDARTLKVGEEIQLLLRDGSVKTEVKEVSTINNKAR